jgi:hypothetical protein
LVPYKKSSAELDSLMTDTEKRLLVSFALNLKNSARLEGKRLKLSIVDDDEAVGMIPTSVFSKDLGILETVVKYLHENERLGLRDISHILKRTQNNIAVSYRNSTLKQPKPYQRLISPISIPITIFSSRYTCFESICLYMKDTLCLSFHGIGKLLDRNERTVWTIYKRAKKKVKDG